MRANAIAMRYCLLLLLFFLLPLNAQENRSRIVPSVQATSEGMLIYLLWYELKPGESKASVTKQSFFAGVPYDSQEIKTVTSLSPQYQVETVENHAMPGAYKLTLTQPFELNASRPYFYGFAAQVIQQEDLVWKIPGADISSETPVPPEYAKYLKQTKSYDVDSPKIKAVIAEVTKGNPGYIERLRRVWQFVNTHMQYIYERDEAFDSDSGYNSASRILGIGRGRCGEFSLVTIALLRGAGIPARVVSSLDAKPWFSTSDHAWVEAFIPSIGWIPVQSQKTLPAESDFHVSFRKYYVLKRYAKDDGDKWIHAGSYKGKGKMNRGHVGVSVTIPETERAAYLALLQTALADEPGAAANVFVAVGTLPADARPVLLWILAGSADDATANAAAMTLGKEHNAAMRKPAEFKKLMKLSPGLIRERLQKVTL